MPSVTHSNPIRAVHAHEDINSKSTHSKARRKFAAAGLSDSAFLWVTILHASPSGTAHHPVHHPVTAMQQKLPRIYMTHVLVPIALAIVSLVLEIRQERFRCQHRVVRVSSSLYNFFIGFSIIASNAITTPCIEEAEVPGSLCCDDRCMP
ncbi:uncharacterized protein LOC135397607 isoform X3 [Ornithodoros turicata]|uniref:uncharacterized protein LOC135397607 isoform X3 n=1 Tax=Ornithodoros turicata TaxID=34597 RepID=UPI003138BA3E